MKNKSRMFKKNALFCIAILVISGCSLINTKTDDTEFLYLNYLVEDFEFEIDNNDEVILTSYLDDEGKPKKGFQYPVYFPDDAIVTQNSITSYNQSAIAHRSNDNQGSVGVVEEVKEWTLRVQDVETMEILREIDVKNILEKYPEYLVAYPTTNRASIEPNERRLKIFIWKIKDGKDEDGKFHVLNSGCHLYIDIDTGESDLFNKETKELCQD